MRASIGLQPDASCFLASDAVTSSISYRFPSLEAALVCVVIPKEAGQLVNITRLAAATGQGVVKAFCHLAVHSSAPHRKPRVHG
jgi:hypothetical protein